jgi:transcriptional regulator with XRE-family HTH domain
MPKDHNPRAAVPQTEPHPVDIYVGSKIKLRRKMVGLSQSALAEHVGKTFQQFQKYETGKNRISASVLYEVAQALRTPIDYFFDVDANEADDTEHMGRARSINDFLRTAEGVELASLYPRIKSLELRRRIVALITTMADEE